MIRVGIGIALALAGVAALLYARGVLPGAVQAAGNAVNPLNPDNVFSQGANALAQAVTGNSVDTLGTMLASGYSDQVGREITEPYVIGDRHGSGLSMDEFLGNPFDVAGVHIYEGPGGAAFGLYPKP